MKKAVFKSTLLALFCIDALAGSVTISWSEPTTYVNGDSLNQNDITRYIIEYSCDDSEPKTIAVPRTTTHTIRGLGGLCFFRIATEGYTKKRNLLTGHFSSPVQKLVPLDAPSGGGFR